MPEDSNDVRKQIRRLRLPKYIRWDQRDVSTGSTARTSWIAKGHLYESAILSVEHTLTYVGAQSDKVEFNVLRIQTSLQISKGKMRGVRPAGHSGPCNSRYSRGRSIDTREIRAIGHNFSANDQLRLREM